MTSILTNPSAMTALQTLTMTMQNLNQTQNQISTGLRITTAADNAAYWSIASTMETDSSVLGTVSDALNLGSSTLGVANAGLSRAISIMGKIKDDLASAAQPGVDRTKIQADITQQQNALSSIATSASFNGQNWLKVDSAQSSFNYTKSVISSYSRDAVNNINVGYIQVNIAPVALMDTNVGNNVTVYKAEAVGTGAPTMPTTPISMSYKDYNALNTAAPLTIPNDANGVPLPDTTTGKITFDTAGSQFVFTDTAGNANNLGASVSVTFNGKTSTLAYNAAAGNAAANISITNKAGGLLDTTDTTTVGSYTDVNGATTTSAAAGTNVSIMTMSIATLTDSAADMATLNSYMKQLDATISQMTSAASNVGAVVSRTSLQQTFVSNLKDSINTGIGSLVDADMNAESTRLQALQVQQQLGIQSLSIANQSSQAILKLFG
jgi:flagellin